MTNQDRWERELVSNWDRLLKGDRSPEALKYFMAKYRRELSERARECFAHGGRGFILGPRVSPESTSTEFVGTWRYLLYSEREKWAEQLSLHDPESLLELIEAVKKYNPAKQFIGVVARSHGTTFIRSFAGLGPRSR
jgi:hypothetical protein